eukprot:scaffold9371_cov211-Amphora_coffeaeformis.AAC.2
MLLYLRFSRHVHVSHQGAECLHLAEQCVSFRFRAHWSVVFSTQLLMLVRAIKGVVAYGTLEETEMTRHVAGLLKPDTSFEFLGLASQSMPPMDSIRLAINFRQKIDVPTFVIGAAAGIGRGVAQQHDVQTGFPCA